LESLGVTTSAITPQPSTSSAATKNELIDSTATNSCPKTEAAQAQVENNNTEELDLDDIDDEEINRYT